MRPRLLRSRALLIPLLLLLFHCAARNELAPDDRLDREFRATLLDSYKAADIVAHVRIAKTENVDTLFADGGAAGYFLNAVSAEVLKPYKGPLKAGIYLTYTFQSDFDAASDSKWARGNEWIVFLVQDGDQERGLRCGEMPCKCRQPQM